VHRAWRTTPYHGVGGWLGAYTTVVAGEGSRLAGDVATPGSGAYYRQILVGSVAAWFGCYLLLYLIVRFVERGSIDSAHTGFTGWHLKPTKTVLLLRLKSRRRSALPGAAAFRVTTNLPRDSDVFTVDITPVGHGPWPLRLWPFRYGRAAPHIPPPTPHTRTHTHTPQQPPPHPPLTPPPLSPLCPGGGCVCV